MTDVVVDRKKAGPLPAEPLPEPVTDPTTRHDFVWVFDCSMGNPNGDPDNDGAPRQDPETLHGMVSGQRMRRAVRNWVATASGFEPDEERRSRLKIYIEQRGVLNEKIRGAYRALDLPTGKKVERAISDEAVRGEISDLDSAGLMPEGFAYTIDPSGENARLAYAGELTPDELKRALDGLEGDLTRKTRNFIQALAREAGSPEKTRDNAEAARGWMNHNYFDVRVFGAVMSTGLDADRETGPVQIPDCRSVDPVTVMDLTITRVAITREEERDDKLSTMGSKYLIPYGLYVAHGFFNPLQAEQTGMTSEDLALFWRSLKDPWDQERSSSRGEMVTRGVHVFSHEHPMGNARAHELFDLVGYRLKDGADAPREFEDYDALRGAEEIRSGLPRGVSYAKLF